MSNPVRYSLYLLILFFAVSLVGLSLFQTPVTDACGQFETACQRRFYLSNDILPDHALYPLMMVRDKVKLTLINPEEKPLLKLQYGQRRLESAQKLLENDKQELALSTVTKAQKYFIEAAELAKQSGDPELIAEVKHLLLVHKQDLAEIRPQFDKVDASVVDQLEAECLQISSELNVNQSSPT